MLALLAAVPEETRLLRQTLRDLESTSVGNLKVWHGLWYDTQICLAHSGLGKAAAAASAMTLINNFQPKALWLFGCGGAFPGSELEIGDIALAECEIFGDEGVQTPLGFQDLEEMGLPMRNDVRGIVYNRWPVDDELTTWAEPLLNKYAGGTERKLATGPFVTVSTCTGTTARGIELAARTGGICENMEGAGASLACRQTGVPFLEVRGISNLVEDRDPARWDLARGMRSAQEAVLDLLSHWPPKEKV
ncbi:MAG: futalosine hydrolase [Desulfuromonadales bacterium]|nr:futalosine hydrolase [Desulfuromonadales bacterium]